MLDDLAFSCKDTPEKLAGMSIHEQIRAARKRLGWSMERLATEVSKAEGLAKPLGWQTVQQWENGTSAPKRTRMLIVAQLLGLDATASVRLTAPELAMLKNYRQLLAKDRVHFDEQIATAAEERRQEFEEIKARLGLPTMGEKRRQSDKAPPQPAPASPIAPTPSESARVADMLREEEQRRANDHPNEGPLKQDSHRRKPYSPES